MPQKEQQDSARKKRTCKERGTLEGFLARKRRRPAKERRETREGKKRETGPRKGKFEKFL
jgi:hypothetical protein